MEKKFLFVDYDTKNIEGKDFIVIYLLEYNSRKIFKIYKLKNNDIIRTLNDFKFAQDITNIVDFVIKRDNNLALNINF